MNVVYDLLLRGRTIYVDLTKQKKYHIIQI